LLRPIPMTVHTWTRWAFVAALALAGGREVDRVAHDFSGRSGLPWLGVALFLGSLALATHRRGDLRLSTARAVVLPGFVVYGLCYLGARGHTIVDMIRESLYRQWLAGPEALAIKALYTLVAIVAAVALALMLGILADNSRGR